MKTQTTIAGPFDLLTNDELLSLFWKLNRDIREEKSKTGPGLYGDVAKANMAEFERQLKAVEKLGKRRRIIK